MCAGVANLQEVGDKAEYLDNKSELQYQFAKQFVRHCPMDQGPILAGQRAATTRLLTLGQTITGVGLSCDETDDLGFMSIAFATKQVAHLESINILLDAGRYADATIIARVMIEGMALLAWAREDPDDRPRKWRAYALVFDLRLMREKQKRGENVPPSEETRLVKRLCEEGRAFLKKPNANVDEESSYHWNWHVDRSGHAPRVSEIVRHIDDGGLIQVYESLSNWIHWNAKGLASGIHRGPSQVRIQWDNDCQVGAATTGGFQALHHALETLDKHFGLGRSVELATLRREYLLASLPSRHE